MTLLEKELYDAKGEIKILKQLIADVFDGDYHWRDIQRSTGHSDEKCVELSQQIGKILNELYP